MQSDNIVVGWQALLHSRAGLGHSQILKHPINSQTEETSQDRIWGLQTKQCHWLANYYNISKPVAQMEGKLEELT